MEKKEDEMTTFQKTFLAVVTVFVVLPLTDANAIPVVATSGQIHMDATTPVPFDDVFVSLAGPEFLLDNSPNGFLTDSFHFTGSPNPGLIILSPGTLVGFSGAISLVAPGDLLVFNGVSYQASGNINVDTAQVVVSSLVSQPFILTGAIHGVSGVQSVDLTLTGAGLMTAHFTPLMNGSFLLNSLTYQVSAIPEPSTVLLFGIGITGLMIWRHRKATMDPLKTIVARFML